jgi:serine/threonine protein kinase/Tfp pilus assembly protein PilF
MMTRVDQDRVMNILAEAVELPPEHRRPFLDSTCAHEPELRRQVEKLLACADPAAAVFDAAAQRIAQPDPDRIGRYEIIEPVGEGGMAVVYKAEQHLPVRRTVALKLVKLGMDTRQFIARFEAERQALALMDHPHVARIYDAGSTDTGRPYFVMEYVAGHPLLDYCDAHQLDLRQRLALFIVVCEAVEHAHRKGIIHRDLKNSNVLVADVDGRPVPKVIDFGVAKMMQRPLGERALQTEHGQMIGTPEYMSPEQAERGGLDVDTRADVYSLGVLLYELIAGVQPLAPDALRRGSFEQIQRAIREAEAPRPSTRLSELVSADARHIAQRRRTALPTLIRSLRSELEWIPLKAMRKDREQRYRSAAELADDIRNYLHARPLLAGPESTQYRLVKFIRRNRVASTAGAVVVLVLLIAASVSIAFGLSERRQRRLAEAARADLEQVAKFQEGQFASIDAQTMGVRLRADLLETVRADAERAKLSPDQVNARLTNLQEIVAGSDFTGLSLDALQRNVFQPAMAAIAQQFPDQPLIRARLLQSLATTLYNLGLLDAATEPQDQSLAIRRRELGLAHPDTLSSIFEMGRLLQAQGKLDQAERNLRQAMDGFGKVFGSDHRDTLNAMNETALLLRRQGKLAETEAYHRLALEKQRRILGDDDPDTIVSIGNLGLVLLEQGKLSEAEPYYREALERWRRVRGNEHHGTISALMNLGSMLRAQGKLDEAEPYLREALEKHRRLLGDEHPETLVAIGNMGLLLRAQGRFAEAEACYREALAQRRRLLGDLHPDTLKTMHNLAFLYLNEGKLEDAEPYYRQVFEQRRQVLSPDHPDLLISMNHLGRLLIAQGNLIEAEPYCREAFERYRAVLGDEHPDSLVSRTVIGDLLRAQGKPAEAIGLLAPAESVVRRAFTGDNRLRVSRFLTALGRARAASSAFADAEANLREAHAIVAEAKAAMSADRAEVLTGLVELYDAWHVAEPHSGHDAQAAQWRSKLNELRSATQPTSSR